MKKKIKENESESRKENIKVLDESDVWYREWTMKFLNYITEM